MVVITVTFVLMCLLLMMHYQRSSGTFKMSYLAFVVLMIVAGIFTFVINVWIFVVFWIFTNVQ